MWPEDYDKIMEKLSSLSLIPIMEENYAQSDAQRAMRIIMAARRCDDPSMINWNLVRDICKTHLKYGSAILDKRRIVDLSGYENE